jgi:hypothetical protein
MFFDFPGTCSPCGNQFRQLQAYSPSSSVQAGPFLTDIDFDNYDGQGTSLPWGTAAMYNLDNGTWSAQYAFEFWSRSGNPTSTAAVVAQAESSDGNPYQRGALNGFVSQMSFLINQLVYVITQSSSEVPGASGNVSCCVLDTSTGCPPIFTFNSIMPTMPPPIYNTQGYATNDCHYQVTLLLNPVGPGNVCYNAPLCP